jgi:hypothetical protein
MKLWLDTTREPEPNWVWAKTAHCAIVMLTGGCVERISFAPDQAAIVTPVLDWMLANNSPARRSVHKHDGGVKQSRGFLKIMSQVASL